MTCTHCNARPATMRVYAARWTGNSYETFACLPCAQELHDWLVRQSWTRAGSLSRIVGPACTSPTGGATIAPSPHTDPRVAPAGGARAGRR